MASAERGRQVIVHSGMQLQAADHDFMKFSIIPSVVLLCDIPDEVSGSWYCNTGDVMVMFKEGAFEPSSPLYVIQQSLQNLLTIELKTSQFFSSTVLQSRELKVFILYSKALLSSYLHIQIIVICTYTACAASFSFSIYLPYLRRAVVTSQIICDVTDVHYDDKKPPAS